MQEIRLYQVGGSIRDELMGIKSNDIDYAVEASSYNELKTYLQSNNYKIFLESPEFLTIRAKSHENHQVVDFSLCRTEAGYSDRRHPNLVKIGTIYEDLARRDFTINAIARSPEGDYIDPFNGLSDIKSKILQCVGSTKDRMQEDALRSLRAIRFIITKGLSPDKELIEVFQEKWLIELLKLLPKDRIRQELHRTFSTDTLATLDFFI